MARKRFIPVSRPHINREDIKFVQKAVASTFIAGGNCIKEFELALAKHCHRRYAVATTNATSALYLALQALALPKNSKVLIPSFTIISLLYAVVANGHIPVFVDVDPHTWNVSLESLQNVLNKGVAAAIIPETYASAPPMSNITRLLRKHHILLIEDAAEGFGGSDKGKFFGSFGTMSILSFYANKLISTGEGGLILTDDKLLYNRLSLLRNLYFDSERTFIHRKLSGNYRMTNIQASLGLSQLKRINSLYEHRRKLYNLYLKYLHKLSNKYINFQRIPTGIKSSYWVFPIMFHNFTQKETKNIMKDLLNNGVETRHFFYPLDRQPCLNEKMKSKSVSYDLWKKGMYLPLGNGISEKEVEVSAQILIKLLLKADN